MLADRLTQIQQGAFGDEIHLPSEAKLLLMNFIAAEASNWRDDSDRPAEISETSLTQQFCGYLTGAAQRSDVWHHIQFRVELKDETNSGRTIDLGATPLNQPMIVEGRRHTRYDILFPIECKRLPTPTGNNRDEREYVTNEPNTTGGIFRFKFSHHGAAHNFGAMIGYVQNEDFDVWFARINGWIRALAAQTNSNWNVEDILENVSNDPLRNIRILRSSHQRPNNLENIELRHLWVCMN